MSKSLPGLPRSLPKAPPNGLTTPDAIIANAAALGIMLGCSEQDMAASCLKFVVTTAEKQGDPDGWLKLLGSQKETN